jgi:hypothetical protein
VWGRGGGSGGYFIEGRRGGRGYTVDATSSLILIYGDRSNSTINRFVRA